MNLKFKYLFHVASVLYFKWYTHIIVINEHKCYENVYFISPYNKLIFMPTSIYIHTHTTCTRVHHLYICNIISDTLSNVIIKTQLM